MTCFGDKKEGPSNSTSSFQPVSLQDPPADAADSNDQSGAGQNPSGAAFKHIEFADNPPTPAALAAAAAAAAAANGDGQRGPEQNRDSVGDNVAIPIEDAPAAADAAGAAANGQFRGRRRTRMDKVFDVYNAPVLLFYDWLLPTDKKKAKEFDPILLNNRLFNAFFGLFDGLLSAVRGPSALPALCPPERLLVLPSRLQPPPEELAVQPSVVVQQQIAAAAAAKAVDRPPMKPCLRRCSIDMQGQQINFYARMISKREFDEMSWFKRNCCLCVVCCCKEKSDAPMRMGDLVESESALEAGLQQAGGDVAQSNFASVALHVPTDGNNDELPGPSAAVPLSPMDDGSIAEQQQGAPRARGVSLVDNAVADACGL